MPPCWATFTVEVQGESKGPIRIFILWLETSSGNLYYDETYMTQGRNAPFRFDVVVEGPPSIMGPFPLEISAHEDTPMNPMGNWFDYGDETYNQRQKISINVLEQYPQGATCQHYTYRTTYTTIDMRTTYTTSRTYTTIDMRTYRTYTDDWLDCRFWWRWGDQQNWWNWCYWRWPWENLQPFDFSLDATPNQQTVKAGESVSFTVVVKLVSGISQAVALSLSNPPSGVTYSFDPASWNPDFTSALKISTDASMPAGSSVLTITGVGGGKTHTATVGLVVARDKVVSSLSISVSPAALKAGESVSVSGTLTPSIATSVELVYVRPDGFEMVKRVSVSGAFSDTVKPDIPGVWFVKARWPGDADRYGSESQQVPVTVEAPPPTPPSFWDIIGGPGTLIAAIAVIIALVALLKLRSRSSGPTQHKPAGKFCMKCGTALQVGSTFCPECGEKTH